MSEEITQELLAEARSMGWVPKEEFRGAEGRWVPADEYVTRGHTVMPILKASNEKLRGEMNGLRAENTRLASLVTASQESIAALEEFHSSETERKVKEVRDSLRRELAEAHRDGDHDTAARITMELSDNAAALAAAKAEPAKKETQLDYTNDPSYLGWVSRNPWFGVDQERTNRTLNIATELRAKMPSTLVGNQFYALVDAELTKVNRVVPAAKVEEGGRGEGGSRSTSGKSYNDLPADAKDACDKFSKRVVGPGRAHKDLASWRASYTKTYFSKVD